MGLEWGGEGLSWARFPEDAVTGGGLLRSPAPLPRALCPATVQLCGRPSGGQGQVLSGPPGLVLVLVSPSEGPATPGPWPGLGWGPAPLTGLVCPGPTGMMNAASLSSLFLLGRGAGSWWGHHSPPSPSAPGECLSYLSQASLVPASICSHIRWGLSPILRVSIKPQTLGGVSLGFGTLWRGWGDLLLPVGTPGSPGLRPHVGVQVPGAQSQLHPQGVRWEEWNEGPNCPHSSAGSCWCGPPLPGSHCTRSLGLRPRSCCFFPTKIIFWKELPHPLLPRGSL